MKKVPFKIIYTFLATMCFTACQEQNTTSSQEAVKQQEASKTDNQPQKTVLFFGDSLTAGYGLDDPADAFPGVIAKKIDSAKLPYKVVNAGSSGETTAGGLNRINWVLRQKVDVFVLELGANDGLRGVPVSDTRKNLQAIIDKVKAKYPKAKLVMLGMQIPPSMGAKYTYDFKAVFPEVAARNNMTLVPFLLNHVGGIAALNQADGIHPTKSGAKIVANENVWPVLKNIL
ncbi:arylesterase [Mucilaginibacter robiniae]|uniref:Arylesterase n=1 Tax=Mucilaginibacter robiniae TaxID=2728022 RepID=A0A7L5E4F5_9SPHI|nr:arylesterase [Mucilaginibacter robiniae]QJD98200.1 arylesterase [Mucilaginibacter robiniae]